jgi:tRNA (guanine-N(7)-)-methyltransferase subunit TRM82
VFYLCTSKMTTSYPVLASASSQKVLVAASSNILHILVRSDGADETYTASLPAQKSIRHLAISADSAHIAAVDDSKTLYIFSTPSSGSPAQLLNSRNATKKCASITFSPDDQNVLYSDKVGDVYAFPIEAVAAADAERPSALALQSDPTLNPDATLVLGHVSVVTDTVCTTTSNGKGRIITSDRDEHIRISRYPLAYVVDKYLFGSEGFVSAIHVADVPPTEGSSSSTLLSAGGERWMRIWDWEAGVQVGRVDVLSAVLPHRRVRAAMRKDKRKNQPAPVKEEGEGTFYSAPEGWFLPTGQGILIKKILSVKVEDKTVVVFYSEGYVFVSLRL